MEIFFLIYIAILSVFKGLGINADNKIYVVSFGIGCLLLGIKILNYKFSKKEIIMMILLLAIGVLDFCIGKTATFLLTAITILGLKNVDIKKAIKVILIVRIITFLIIVISSIVGLIPQNNVEFYRDGKFITRYSLGYPYPNTLQISFSIIVALTVYVFWNNIKFLHIIIAELLNIVLYFLTYSRTGFIITTFLLVFVLILKKNSIMRKSILYIGKNLYCFLFILTIVCAVSYGKLNFLDTMNEVLTGRIEYMNKLITEHPIPIIGSDEYNYYVNIDNGYISLLYEGGLLAFILMSYLIIKLSNRLYIQKKYPEMLLLIFFLITAFTESFFMSASMNISLLFIGMIVFEGENKRNDRCNNIHTNLQ